jgi:hypothetical protein
MEAFLNLLTFCGLRRANAAPASRSDNLETSRLAGIGVVFKHAGSAHFTFFAAFFVESKAFFQAIILLSNLSQQKALLNRAGRCRRAITLSRWESLANCRKSRVVMFHK